MEILENFNAKYLEFNKITDPRGCLTYLQKGVGLPFDLQRVYYLYDVPGGAERGAHGHRSLEQVMIALSGSFDVILDNGSEEKKFTLNLPNRGLYVGPMMWRSLTNFSSGAVCLVLASQPYDESDYFRDYDNFLKEVRS